MPTPSRLHLSRAYLYLHVALCILLGLILFTSFHQEIPSRLVFNQTTCSNDVNRAPADRPRGHCDAFKPTNNIAVTVKAGATEVFEKILPQAITSLRCSSTTWYFSDLEQRVGDIHLHDAIGPVDDSVKQANPDFDYYRLLLERHRAGLITSTLKDLRQQDHAELAAWELDKYKNIHIAGQIWSLQPGADWYIYIDADTYVVWSSLTAWLEKLNPSEKLFLGSLTMLGDEEFAHGGSGMVVSRAAMKAYTTEYNHSRSAWDARAKEKCCGDLVFSQTLMEVSIKLKESWPSINGEALHTIPFDDTHWCQPVVTMHHVPPEQMQYIASFEENRKDPKKPLIYLELFLDLILDTIPESVTEDWDNMSQSQDYTGESLPDTNSWESCESKCEARPDCLQFRYNGENCVIAAQRVVLGIEQKPDQNKKWHSGWNKKHIAEWIKSRDTCAGKVTFPHVG